MKRNQFDEWLSRNTKIIEGLHAVIDYLNEEVPEEVDKVASYREMLEKIYEMEDKEAKK